LGQLRIQAMVDERALPGEPLHLHEDTLAHMLREAFVAAWKGLVGEPPAAMLESRSEMIRVLVASTPIVDPTAADVSNGEDLGRGCDG
jgi:hypothetical protein